MPTTGTKAGKAFAVALASRGITVNAISPGITEDSILNSLLQEVQDGIRSWHVAGWTPMGRLGTLGCRQAASMQLRLATFQASGVHL
jgi:NAD(P)-dependent dehydrogenase (short-subunit alcohol dehydrogenase family)